LLVELREELQGDGARIIKRLRKDLMKRRKFHNRFRPSNQKTQ
jgi:hypothetical protein